MARKGFWQRLFGGGEDPDPAKPEPTPEPGPTETPTDAPAEPSTETEPGLDTDLPAYPQRDEPKAHQNPPPADEPTAVPESPADPDAPEDGDGPPTDEPLPPPAPEPRDQSETTLPETAELKTDAVGRVYAQSLLDMAQDAGQTDAIAEEVAALLPLVEPGGELYLLVTNPAISTDERSKIVANVFEGKVSDLLYRFLQIVTAKGRLGSLETILGGYLMGVSEARGLVDVDAYVAAPMDADTASRVGREIGAALGKEVTLRQHVDESLIGGLKIKIGDKLIDASVASQLNQIKRNMMQGR